MVPSVLLIDAHINCKPIHSLCSARHTLPGMGQNEGANSQPYQIQDPELFMQKGKNFKVQQGLSTMLWKTSTITDKETSDILGQNVKFVAKSKVVILLQVPNN